MARFLDTVGGGWLVGGGGGGAQRGGFFRLPRSLHTQQTLSLVSGASFLSALYYGYSVERRNLMCYTSPKANKFPEARKISEGKA